MTGWTVPPSETVPPRPGLGPPPAVANEYRPEDEDLQGPEDRVRWSEAAAEADRHKTTEDLVRDAAHTRDQVNHDVYELRHKLGMDDEARARRLTASGPFGPVRRHPFTVAMAGVGATVAAAVGLRIARGRRKHAKLEQQAAERRRKAVKRRIGEARDTVASAASDLRHQGGKAVKRLAHR